MAKAKNETQTSEVSILKMNTGRVTMCILGTSPLIMNRMSEKVMQGLLLPRAGKKSAAEKALHSEALSPR